MPISFTVELDNGGDKTSDRDFTTLKSMRSFIQANARTNFNVLVNDGDKNLITLPSKCYWKHERLGAHPTLDEMLKA